MRLAAITALCLLAVACGPGPGKINKVQAAPPLTGPTFTTTGTLSSVTLDTATIDHAAAPEAGLAAGRTQFHTFADVMAMAPEAPGAPVTLSFRKQGDSWALTRLEPAPAR